MSNKILIIFIGVLMVFMLGMGGGLFLMWSKLSAINVQGNANAGVQPGEAAAVEPGWTRRIARRSALVRR